MLQYLKSFFNKPKVIIAPKTVKIMEIDRRALFSEMKRQHVEFNKDVQEIKFYRSLGLIK